MSKARMKAMKGEIAEYVEKCLKKRVNEFIHGEFQKMLKFQRFYDDPNVRENIKNRAFDEVAKDLLFAQRKFQNCDVFPDFTNPFSKCHRAGISTCVNGQLKYYCDIHEEQRRIDYDSYHAIDYAQYQRTRHRSYNLQRRAAREHARRIKYRRTFNLRTDGGHANFEGTLMYLYRENFKVCPRTAQVDIVSIRILRFEYL